MIAICENLQWKYVEAILREFQLKFAYTLMTFEIKEKISTLTNREC